MASSFAQVTNALKSAGFGRTPTPQDLANAQKYGLGIFGATRNKIVGAPAESTGSTTGGTDTSTDSITKTFLDSVKGLLAPADKQPAVTPFDQSGFYSEGDARTLADQEYNPYYDALKAYTDTQNAATDKNALETVNASGGFRSSAYANDQALRRQDLLRQGQQMTDEERAAKEQFVGNRRQDAYNRYLQSIGSLAT